MIGLVYNNSSQLYLDACKRFKRYGEYIEFNENKLDKRLDDCEWYVLVGNDIKGRPVKEYVYNSGKPFFVITGNYFDIKDNGYVRILVNGYLNHFGQTPMVTDYGKWEQVRGHYKLKPGFYQNVGYKIVLALNSKTSPSLFDTKIEDWVVDVVTKIRANTCRPIHIRHHRKQKEPYSSKMDELKRFDKIFHEKDELTNRLDFRHVGAAVTFNSTYSVLALHHGVCNITTHPGSPVYDVTPHDFSIKSLETYPDREMLFDYYLRLSSCMWRVDEIGGDLFWKLYEPLIKENKRENFHWLGQ